MGSVAAAVLVMSIVFAGLWVTRGKYVARLEAERQYEQFVDRLPAARMAASVPDSEGPLVASGIDAVSHLLRLYGMPKDERRQDHPGYLNLPPVQRQDLDARLVELGYLAARGEAILAKLAKDDATANEHWARALQFNDVAWEPCQAVGSQQAVLKQRNGLLNKLGRPPGAESNFGRRCERPVGRAASRSRPSAESRLLRGRSTCWRHFAPSSRPIR